MKKFFFFMACLILTSFFALSVESSVVSLRGGDSSLTIYSTKLGGGCSGTCTLGESPSEELRINPDTSGIPAGSNITNVKLVLQEIDVSGVLSPFPAITIRVINMSSGADQNFSVIDNFTLSQRPERVVLQSDAMTNFFQYMFQNGSTIYVKLNTSDGAEDRQVTLNKTIPTDIEMNITYTPPTPVLTFGIVNVSNQTLHPGDFFNVSANLTEAAGNKMNVTVQYWYNGILNRTINANNNYLNNTLFSYVFNDTDAAEAGTILFTFIATNSYANSTQINTSVITLNGTAPQIVIITPVGNYTSRNNLPLNYTITEETATSVCFFNVTRSNGLPEITNTNVNCVGATNTTFSVGLDDNFTGFFTANDSLGKINITNFTFNVSTTQSGGGNPGDGGGGGASEGGGGAGSAIVCKDGSKSWEVRTPNRATRFLLKMVPGSKRVVDIEMFNNGTDPLTLKFSCIDTTESLNESEKLTNGLCAINKPAFEEIVLNPEQVRIEQLYAVAPQTASIGEKLSFNIRIEDPSTSCKGTLRFEEDLSYSGILFKLSDTYHFTWFNKLTNKFPVIPIPIWLVVLVVDVFLWLGIYALMKKLLSFTTLEVSFSVLLTFLFLIIGDAFLIFFL